MSNERDAAKAGAVPVQMASVPANTERDAAKADAVPIEVIAASIQASGSLIAREPRMREAMGAADQLKAELQEQRHLQKMKTKEVGWFGVVFGTESLASIIIAFSVIVLSFITAITFEIIGAKTGKQEFWSHEAQTAFSIITAALGFIFGRTNKDPK